MERYLHKTSSYLERRKSSQRQCVWPFLDNYSRKRKGDLRPKGRITSSGYQRLQSVTRIVSECSLKIAPRYWGSLIALYRDKDTVHLAIRHITRRLCCIKPSQLFERWHSLRKESNHLGVLKEIRSVLCISSSDWCHGQTRRWQLAMWHKPCRCRGWIRLSRIQISAHVCDSRGNEILDHSC